MSKIVQAVNSMIANPQNISQVMKGYDEYFFLYKGQYKWSMADREEGVFLWFYPGSESIPQLASYENEDWENVTMVKYNTEEIGTKEAKASFLELHTLLKENLFGIKDVLDDIIEGGKRP